ncbi:uncharacterized protein L201_003348 [Kwoniella dendrophila CBS 6074]|uniref:non-specific serine/threonine protein kinase n=1 Tax=Kwoniella dendrophila CBS 6074 TaxID=1295534 RepID=A0AAX4JV48_9TREE
MSRRSTEGYIDQRPSPQDDHPILEEAHQFDDASSSGSSIEEESEGEPFDAGDISETPIDQIEDQEEDWDVDDEDWELANGVRQQHAATTGNAPLPARNAPALASLSKLNVPAHVGVAMNPKAAHEKQDKDKSDRATQDQVLDSRTRLVLAGLVNRNLIGKIERCANVYFASPGVAVKIYRTSILNFRSRSNYIVGEQRFRGEYTSSKNPRKMIRVWAEKELRNLRRLVQGGICAPKVLDCKENVLVMEFLGQGDDASPRLKDVEIESDRVDSLYAELLIAVRRMYQHCHLVHADLSEYNILHEEELSPNGDAKLAGIVTEWLTQPSNKTDDAVFLSSYIPRTLAEVYDPERDVDLLKKGGGDDLIYAGITGLKLADQAEPKDIKEVRFEETEEQSDLESGEESEESPHKPRGFRHEDKDAKKERKKALKEENREKRKNKMPKAEKQRLIKKSHK